MQFLAANFQVMQQSIPEEYQKIEEVQSFSDLPENMQIKALQQNVVNTLAAMLCADKIGANFLLSLLATLAALNDNERMMQMLQEIEDESEQNKNQ